MTPSPQSRASLLVLGSVLLWSHVAAGASFAKADKKGSAKLTCPKGAFLDPRLDDWSKGPECWSCPKGYGRTAEPVTSDKACLREGGEVFDKADKVGKWTCNKKQDEFFDPRKGGECWSCPSKTPRRTLYAVTSDKACASKIGVLPEKLSKANFEHK